MIIGICGKSGSGKTTLAKEIMNQGNICKKQEAIHVDIDQIGHRVLELETVKEQLGEEFGTNIIENNVVNRKKLAQKTFNSEKNMQKLIDITWPSMQDIINDLIILNKENIIILDWQLLQKTEYFNMCDITVLLEIPYKIRKERCLERDKITEEQFDLREKASYNYNKKAFDIILTELHQKNIRKVVKEIWR